MSKRSLTEAFADAKLQFAPIKRNKKGHYGLYASLDQIYEAVDKALSTNGLVLSDTLKDDNLFVTLRHESGEVIESSIRFVPESGIENWMEAGKALTYARRYLTMGILGIAPDDEDVDNYPPDSEANNYEPPPSRVKPPPAETDKLDVQDGKVVEVRIFAIEPIAAGRINNCRLSVKFWLPNNAEGSALLFAGDPVEYIAKAFCYETADQLIAAVGGRVRQFSETPLRIRVIKKGQYWNILPSADMLTPAQRFIADRLIGKHGLNDDDLHKALNVEDFSDFKGSLDEAHSRIVVFKEKRESRNFDRVPF